MYPVCSSFALGLALIFIEVIKQQKKYLSLVIIMIEVFVTIRYDMRLENTWDPTFYSKFFNNLAFIGFTSQSSRPRSVKAF